MAVEPTVVEDKQQEDTLERILNEAERLFAVQGYKGVSMSQLADACNISKPALYYYFRDKQELYVQVLMQQIARHHRQFTQGLSGQTVAAGLRWLSSYLQISGTYDMSQMRSDLRSELDEERRAMVNQAFFRDFFGPIRALFVHGIATGELRADVDADMATWMYMNIMSAICNPNNIMPLNTADGRSVNDVVVETLLDGVRNKDRSFQSE